MHSPTHKLVLAKHYLQNKHPALGAALEMVSFKATDEEGWHTASLTTDGSTIWYNSRFVNMHHFEEMVFYMGYMAYVIRDRMFEDTAAVEGLERWRINLAQCYLINRKLSHDGVGKLPRNAVMHHGLTVNSTLEDALKLVPQDEAALAHKVNLTYLRDRPPLSAPLV